MSYQKVQTKLIREGKESDVKMQSVRTKIAIEYLERELNLRFTKNDCTEALLMHIYWYVRNVVANFSRRVVWKTNTKDVLGKEESKGRKNARNVRN